MAKELIKIPSSMTYHFQSHRHSMRHGEARRPLQVETPKAAQGNLAIRQRQGPEGGSDFPLEYGG